MVCTKALLPIVIVIGAFIAASFHVRNRSAQLRQSNMIARPMIGNVYQVNREGPWPECVGMESWKCLERIQSLTDNIDTIETTEEGSGYCEGFRPSRVCLVVDKEDVVTKIPHKG
ncbi:hypothetical protein ACA910_018114 [Epithemia clementina (nom. ined.)]